MSLNDPLYPTTRSAFWGGARESVGVPMLIMGASFVGFGTMVNNAGWSVWMGLFSTLSTWALPGQVAMVEMATQGAPLISIILAVTFINARLLPMVASLLPHVRRSGVPGWTYYIISMFVAATSWVGTMRRLPDLMPDQRLSFLLGYGTVLFLGSPLFTIVGFYLADQVPSPIAIAMVYLNPLYLMLLFVGHIQNLGRFIALGFGVVLGPITYLYFPDWSVVVTGLVGGTAAWGLGRYINQRRASS